MRLHQRIRRAKLEGEQLDITFPRRGRPSRFRRLERAGQMSLDLQAPRKTHEPCAIHTNHVCTETRTEESPDAALDYLFPVGPLTDDQLTAEFNRLFPLE